MTETPEKALERLLKELFTVEQLRRFLGDLPGGGALVDELPSAPASAAEVIHHAVGELKRNGMVDKEFFEELLGAKPKQGARIRETATAWRVSLPEPVAAPPAAAASAAAAGAPDPSAGSSGASSSSASAASRVFLSYSHDSPTHEQAVLALANRLRADGIDAWIDRYEPNPPQGWPRWMQEQVEKARYILLVCTETYMRRFDGKEEAGKGKGATWEGLLATQVLYDAGTVNKKLVPVLLDGASEEQIPLVLRPYTHYRLPAGYDDLVRHLTGQPAVVPPPLGKVRAMPPVTRGPALAPQPVVSAGLPATPTAIVQQGGQHVDNRGAQIGQVINVQGGATFTFGSIPEVPKKR